MNPATVTAPAGTQPGTPPAIVRTNPFVRASFEHEEPFYDATVTPGASTVAVGPFPVASYGYLSAIYVEVESIGSSGASTFRADAPWSALSEVVFQDINGAPVFGPLSGYDAYLVNKWGGYEFLSDPALSPNYAASTSTGAFKFAFRIPVQLGRRDALGSLPNMNAAATYQVRLSLAPLTQIYASGPSVAPTGVRVRCTLEAWAMPPATDRSGVPNAVQPPGLGTTQFWSKQTMPTVNGSNTLKLTRQGNYLRNVLLVNRDNTGARSDSTFPADTRWMVDSQEIFNRSKTRWQHIMRERGGQVLDTGVYLIGFTHDFSSQLGAEMRDLWRPSEQSTKSELIGSFGGAGTLDVLTNDVAVTTPPFVS